MRYLYALPLSALVAGCFVLAYDYIMPISNTNAAIIYGMTWLCMALYLILEDHNEQ